MGKIKDLLKNKIAKAGISYTFGNYLLKGLSFITVPIFSRLLTTEDYGIYNTFLAYEAMLYLFVGFAVHSSIKNAKYEYGDDQLDKYTSSVTLIPIINLTLLLIVGNILEVCGIQILSMNNMQLNMLFLYSFSSSLLYIYRARLILDYRTRDYLFLSYFNAIASVLFSLFFVLVVYPETKYVGRIWGTVLPMALVALWILIKLFKKAKPKICKEYWKFGLKISVPIIPHGVGQIILSSFDRIMISNMIGSTEAGLYSFAYTIYSIVLITGNSISTVFEPWAFERLAVGEEKQLKKRSGQIVCGLALVCTLTMFITPELVVILGSEKYRASIPAVMPILLGGFFSMAYVVPAVVEYYYKKTGYIALGTMVAAVLNIIFNAIFIPKFGYVAAAYTTLVSYLLYFIFHTLISRRLAGFYIVPMRAIIVALAILAVGVFTIQTLENDMIARYGMLLAFMVIACLFIRKQMRKGEKNEGSI